MAATDPSLPANLLYPSIRLFLPSDMTGARPHLPLEEHVYRRPNEPNTFTYELPHEDYEVAVLIRNMDSKPVSLLQRCLPTHGPCLDTKVVPPNAEVELPCRRLPHVVCDGYDILNSDTQELLMRLRFNFKPAPALAHLPAETYAERVQRRKQTDWSHADPNAVPRPHDPDSRYDRSPHAAPHRLDPTQPPPRRWWPFGTRTPLPQATLCDVIDEHDAPQASDDTNHAALLTQMRALLLAV